MHRTAPFSVNIRMIDLTAWKNCGLDHIPDREWQAGVEPGQVRSTDRALFWQLLDFVENATFHHEVDGFRLSEVVQGTAMNGEDVRNRKKF